MPFHHGIGLCGQGLSIKMLFSGYLRIDAFRKAGDGTFNCTPSAPCGPNRLIA